MAARWVGLSRPKKKNRARAVAHTFKQCVHALGAGGVLVMAAAMNFALYPDALAAVVSGEPMVVGFVPEESANRAAGLPIEVNEEEVRLLAATAWGEARSEGEDGMRAVAHVMVNRVGERFGENLETVILAPKQFSAWNRGDPNRPLVQNPERYATGGIALETWETAQQVAREVLSGQSADPTNGALFYHTRAIRPYWSRYGEGRTEIGAHVFYRDVPNQRNRARRGQAQQIADASPSRRGARAGRVNGVIQYAPADAARQELPGENVNAAATPTLNGVPVANASAAASAP